MPTDALQHRIGAIDPYGRRVSRAAALALLLVAVAPASARGTAWRWPVAGRIVGSFSVSPGDPYAAGQRRGIAIAAAPGAPVRAACGGPVAFSGSVGRAGPTVSVVCGRLRATYQGLAATGVRAGTIVLPGRRLAVLGAAGVLRLGARVEPRPRTGPSRYTDPARLLGAARRPPLGPAPAPRAAPEHGAPRSAPVLRPLPPRPEPVPAPAAAGRPRPPLLAWLGVVLLAATLPGGALWRRSRRHRAHRRAPVRAPAARG